MSRTLRTVVLMLLVAACGGGKYSAPRDLDDACGIVSQRPHYLRAMQRAEQRWNVPVHVQMATIYQESKFVGNARTPRRYTLWIIPSGRQSSAFGYSQALDGTWDDYRRATGKRRARRTDIDDATDFIGWYMAGTRRSLGISTSDARNQYLAYHEGRNGYRRGSHKSKSWLLRVANEVDSRAGVYRRQLARCRVA